MQRGIEAIEVKIITTNGHLLVNDIKKRIKNISLQIISLGG